VTGSRGATTRHLLTLGAVASSSVSIARESWRASRLNQRLRPDDSVLILFDPDTTPAARYVETLVAIERQRLPFGVLPVGRSMHDDAALTRRLGVDTLAITFEQARFQMMLADEATEPLAPPIVRRVADSPQLAQQLREARLLYLQGHSGPVDAAFGRWFYLCSRDLYESGTPFYPCFGTDRCFRQYALGRPATSREGLVDPRTLGAELAVLDGCSTLTVPGSLFPYRTSLGRAIVESQVRVAVLTLGANAMPFSGVVMFVALLAEGYTVGEAVRQANRHAHDSRAPTSIVASGVAPWIVVGNPESRVTGLRLLAPPLEPTEDGFRFDLHDADVPAETGAIVRLHPLPSPRGTLDVLGAGDRWVYGALHGEDTAYVWASRSQLEVDGAHQRHAEVRLTRRSLDRTPDWRSLFAALHADSGWLEALANLVKLYDGDSGPLRTLAASARDLIPRVEDAAATAIASRPGSVEPPLSDRTAAAVSELTRFDRTAADVVARGLAAVRIRTYNLWSPPLTDLATVAFAHECCCGAPVTANVLEHATVVMTRLVLSCPGCGAIAHVASCPTLPGAPVAEIRPAVVGFPLSRHAAPGDTLCLPVQRIDDEPLCGFGCSAIIDQFRECSRVTEASPVEPACDTSIVLVIPEDWPLGLAQVVTVVAVGGALSFLDFDLLVTDDPQYRPLA
jgi:hypothetical protein